MTEDLLNKLAGHEIYSYGSAELLKFEKQMAKYFEREYRRWRDSKKIPEDYGISSFEGDIAKKETRDNSVGHYDEEYRVYRSFLDNTYMAYTMGYFGATEDSPNIQEISLEQAQINKYKLLIERADISDGQLILDLGCGYGGLSKYLLQTFPGVYVTGINPSQVQTRYIKDILIKKDNDFDNSRFTLVQKFFDDVTADDLGNNIFDRVVSIGLLEHVTNIDLLQMKISGILKKGGKCIHHCIVSSSTMPNYLNSEDSYMGHYYPGAHIWPFHEPERHNNHLKYIDSWFMNGMNYWKTLDLWHKRFWQEVEHLYPRYLSIEEIKDWNKYFSLCKSMFIPDEGKSYGNGQYLYEKY